ncbi:PGPGW domain-containing protein [Streptomyces ziwulingensis]
MGRSVEPIRRAALGSLGAVLVVIGIALLVLPGPGLLLVFAGVVLLARAVPALDRFVAPARIAGSVLVGLLLIGAGLAWGLVSRLPYSGWGTGASLILSGCILFALLFWSHRRVRATRRGFPSTAE